MSLIFLWLHNNSQSILNGILTFLWQARLQSHSQRPRSFWLATGIATSGQVQLRKSLIHRLPVTLRMLRVKSDKSDWFWSRSIVFTKPFKTRMSLDLARGPDFSSACQKGHLGTRLARLWSMKNYKEYKGS